ncbi:MAG: C39 family peptidase [Armatimonadetes bacterium]|nr:C39 family peptidase [Armatimonadota bacterium]
MNLFLAGLILADMQNNPVQTFWAVEDFSNWTKTSQEWTSPVIETNLFWKELILSWSASALNDAPIHFQVQQITTTRPTKWYTMGVWSNGPSRMSVKKQRDENGDVDTDTFFPNVPGGNIRVRIKFTSPPKDNQVTRVAISATDPKLPDSAPPNKAAWGKPMDVSMRSQMSYKNGNVLCSPTSLSMLLLYWSQALSRPNLDHDVPDVVAGVYDKNWPGTGNWPFNTGFAAQQPGLISYVTRLRSIRDLEDWIARGVPVATSVSYDLLKGKEIKGKNDGHLVVCIGFDPEGNPVFNDPGRSKEVRQTYKRDAFRRAWENSGRTVYLVYPRTWMEPQSPGGPWMDS